MKTKIRHAMAGRYINQRMGTIHCAPTFFNSLVGA